MIESRARHSRTLGICPSGKGFGFAVLEVRGRLISWGVARLCSKSVGEFAQRLECMMDKYQIDILCVEGDLDRRCGQRVRRMHRKAVEVAQTRMICAYAVNRTQARAAVGLGERATKYVLAARLTEIFPELAVVIPPPRKPWQTEDERMKLFEAVSVSLVLCHEYLGQSTDMDQQASVPAQLGRQ